MNTTPKPRIRIYTNVRRSLEMARKVYEKHLADGNGSILSSMDGFSWEATGPKINLCLEKHQEAINLSKSSEELYRQRDAVLAEITDIMNASRSLLKNRSNANPRELSGWEFAVNDNSQLTATTQDLSNL